VKASWHNREIRLTWAFVLAMLFGGAARPTSVNPNRPGDVSKFGEDSLRLLVEEGRRQLQEQTDRFTHATERAQALLTVGIVVLGFVSATFQHANDAWEFFRVAALTLWVLGLALTLVGLAAAAAVIVVQAEFKAVDTTQASTWTPPIDRRLAADYVEAVVLGETTVAARVTVFQQATRLVSWGAVVAAFAFILGAIP